MPFDPGGGPILSAKAIAEPPDYDRARAVAEYHDVVRRLIIGFKYYDRLEARQLLGRWMVMAGQSLLQDADAIVPVPLHRVRLLSRRFNQSAVLGREIARLTGKPIWYDALARRKRTPQQVTLTGPQRLKNPRGAFSIRKRHAKRIQGARIVLVDDVLTTGATVNACARALKAAGAARVDVLVVALANDRPDVRDF